MNWFNVDKQGLAAILERRGKFFALAELISNAWDSGTDEVSVHLDPIPGQAYATLEVEDWGEGFADLNEANTMFARSRRANDAGKRGRFNLGEKLALAVCREARIATTTGTIYFNADGTVRRTLETRSKGTSFFAEIRMTRDEYAVVCDSIARLIPPVQTRFNGAPIADPAKRVAIFTTKLPTEIADADGMMRRSVRACTVEVYRDDTGPGEVCEMGIPVVETDNGFRVNVLQKIPLNMERDNVTPAFLKSLQAALLNSVHGELDSEQAGKAWVQEAVGDARALPETVKDIIVKRFGERAVAATPGDPLANAAAEAAGFSVVHGGSLPSDVWSNVRKHGTLQSSATVFPTPTPEAIAKRNEGREACSQCGRPL